uniref:Putative secreted protein n=1 Tax=Ixodes ricinus TaxID=34613 RepID=A0A6B0V4E6_IXORI
MTNNFVCLACVCILLPVWAEADSRQHSSKQEQKAWTMQVGLVLDVEYRDLNRSSLQALFKDVEDYFAMKKKRLLLFAPICAPNWQLEPIVYGDYIDGIQALSQLTSLIASSEEYQNLDFLFVLTRKGIQATYNQGIHFMGSYFEFDSTVCEKAVPVIVRAEGTVKQIAVEIAKTLAEVIGRKVENEPETQKQCLPVPRVLKCCEWARICVFLECVFLTNHFFVFY